MTAKLLYKQAYDIYQNNKYSKEAFEKFQEVIINYPDSEYADYAEEWINEMKKEGFESDELEEKKLNSKSKPNNENNNPKENRIAIIIKFIGIGTMVIGFIMGIVTGQMSNFFGESVFSLSLALPSWISGFVIGFLIIGFSEVIRLLHSINLKLEK